MNIDLIKSDAYKKIIDRFVKPYPWIKATVISEFPFEERGFYMKNMKNKPSINNFNLIKKIKVMYDIDQYIYGILNLNNIDYVVSIDNEFTVSVVGDTESNWLCYMFHSVEQIDKFKDFMQDCYDEFRIEIKDPDFENYLYVIEDKYLKPLIWNV